MLLRILSANTVYTYLIEEEVARSCSELFSPEMKSVGLCQLFIFVEAKPVWRPKQLWPLENPGDIGLNKIQNKHAKVPFMQNFMSMGPMGAELQHPSLLSIRVFHREDSAYMGYNLVPPINTRSLVVELVKLMSCRQAKSLMNITVC